MYIYIYIITFACLLGKDQLLRGLQAENRAEKIELEERLQDALVARSSHKNPKSRNCSLACPDSISRLPATPLVVPADVDLMTFEHVRDMNEF